jgi:hypothetical protein
METSESQRALLDECAVRQKCRAGQHLSDCPEHRPFQVFQVLERSRNDPDSDPRRPPQAGMWVWVRQGPHPMGVWETHDTRGAKWSRWYQENQKRFPVLQDRAHGAPSDFGNYSCHACEYFGEGFPEPGHRTECDGLCKLMGCEYDHEQ